MNYQRMKSIDFLKEMQTEEQARQWIWKCRFGEKGFVCPQCQSETFWQHHRRPEMRECTRCRRQVRLRAGTVFENAKKPLLIWIKAIALMMQDKRGVAATEIQRQLGLKIYETAWTMAHKIRESLRQRDEIYQLKGTMELDGSSFGKRDTDNQGKVLIAIEAKEWVDAKGRRKEKAGFAKVKLAPETKQEAQNFVDQAIQTGSMVNTDASPSFRDLKNVDVDYQVTAHDPTVLKHWLPWVHRFISNAKAWTIGAHHGVKAKYLGQYLAEYTYRFNRRHDPDSLIHRDLTACVLAKPLTLQALSR